MRESLRNLSTNGTLSISGGRPGSFGYTAIPGLSNITGTSSPTVGESPIPISDENTDEDIALAREIETEE